MMDFILSMIRCEDEPSLCASCGNGIEYCNVKSIIPYRKSNLKDITTQYFNFSFSILLAKNYFQF